MNIFTFASNHPLLTTALIVALLLALSILACIVVLVRALMGQPEEDDGWREVHEQDQREAERLRIREIARKSMIRRIENQIAVNNAIIDRRKKLKKRGLGVKDLRQANTALRNRTLELAAQ